MARWFTEARLGLGTLGYKGETAEYYESKRGLWDRFRWVLAGACLALGVAALVASATPVVSARVVSVVDNPSAAANRVELLAPDGATATVTMSYADTPSVGDIRPAMKLPGGRLVDGDHTGSSRTVAVLFLALGAGIVARAVWRIRHPRPQVTTVIVPDDTYARPPQSS